MAEGHLPAADAGGDGEKLFALTCAPCHGKDGKGQTPIGRKLSIRDLTASILRDAEIEKQIAEGKLGPDGKQRMPPFRGKISAEQMKTLLPVIKRLRQDRAN